MDRSSRQKLNKETKALNNTLDQLDLIDIYRAFHPKIIHFTIYSSAHGTFSRRDHIKPWVIIKKLRSFQASFQITVLQYKMLGTRKQKTIKSKHREAKKHASE